MKSCKFRIFLTPPPFCHVLTPYALVSQNDLLSSPSLRDIIYEWSLSRAIFNLSMVYFVDSLCKQVWPPGSKVLVLLILLNSFPMFYLSLIEQ